MVKDVRAPMNELRRQEHADRFTDISKEALRYSTSEYDLRKKKFPIRTGIAAISLFALGSILIFISTRIGLDGEHRGLSFLILGLIGT